MKNNRNYEIDMCHGPILRKMLVFTIPLICSSILQLLFNAADVIVVGRYAGDNSLAAVGSTGSLIGLITNLFLGLSVGANVLVARYYGAKREEELSETVHTAILVSIYSGVLLTFVGVFGAKQILVWMQTPKEVVGLATLYLRIYFLGMPSMMVYNFGSAILRAVGDTKRPLYFLTGTGVVNVLLNLLFVIKFQWDVAGVATATVISQTIAALLILGCLRREQGGIRLVLGELHIHKDKIIGIVKIGIPAGIQGIIFALSNVLIQSSVNSFGAVIVAGNSAAINIESFVYITMNAFHQATISFVGQNMGAGNYKRINRIVLLGEICVMTVGLVFGNLVVLGGKTLLGFYTTNGAVVKAGMRRLRSICTVYALCGMMDVMVGALRGIGYSMIPMLVSIVGVCGVRILWLATVFQIPEYHNIEMIYFSYPVSWTLTFLVQVLCFFWAKKRITKKAEVGA